MGWEIVTAIIVLAGLLNLLLVIVIWMHVRRPRTDETLRAAVAALQQDVQRLEATLSQFRTATGTSQSTDKNP